MKVKSNIEWAPFTIKKGITEQALLKASSRLQEDFLKDQSGFIKRELIKKSEKEYIDVVYWNSRIDADRAVVNSESSPACYAYFQLMEMSDHGTPGAGVTHFELVTQYQND